MKPLTFTGQLVPGQVSEAVVDLFEAVEVFPAFPVPRSGT